MIFIFELLIGGFLLILAIGLMGAFLKFFIKVAPAIIVAGFLLWLLIDYTLPFLLVIGVLLAIAAVIGISNNNKIHKNIENDCMNFLSARDVESVAELFHAYNEERKKIFIKKYSGNIAKFKMDENTFFRELFFLDFLKFSEKYLDEENEKIIIEKNIAINYIKSIWDDTLSFDLNEIKRHIKLKTNLIFREEQIVVDKNSSRVALIVIEKPLSNSIGNVISMDD